MPIDYQLDPNGREVVVRLTGVVPEQELLTAVDRILSDPRLPKAPLILWDAREREDVPEASLTEPLIQLLNRHELALRGGRCALLTSRDAIFGMQRLFTLRSELRVPFEMRPFRDLEQARSWLRDPRGGEPSS